MRANLVTNRWSTARRRGWSGLGSERNGSGPAREEFDNG